MSAPIPVLGLRADGGPGRGVGHVARSLALAQAWRDTGGQVVLATKVIPDDWRARYSAEGVAIGAPGAVAADVWVIDGYDLGPDVAGGRPHVRIDDRGETSDPTAALVIDQNLGADPSDYVQPPDRLLLGPTYALLRRDLVAAAGEPRIADPDLGGRKRVLVAQGGAPAAEVQAFTAAVTASLESDGMDVVVWRGRDDPLPALRSADAALAAAGSTLWELCLFGIPAVVFTVAPNQVPLAAAMVEAGLADAAGAVPGADPEPATAQLRAVLADDEARATRSAQLRTLVDGQGAARIAADIQARFSTPT